MPAAGLATVSPYATTPYNGVPPAGAIDLVPFTSFAAAIAACRTADKPLKIAAGNYNVPLSDHKLQAPRGIYGYGGRPVLTCTAPSPNGSSVGAFIYMFDNDFVTHGCEYVGFGDVFTYCVASVDRGSGTYVPYFNQSETNFTKGVPNGVSTGSGTGIGVEIDVTKYPRVLGTYAMHIDLSDTYFTNCARSYRAVSDTVIPASFNAHRCKLNGTWSIIDHECTTSDQIFITGCEWFNCLISNGRQMTSSNAHGFHTFARIGVEEGTVDVDVIRSTIHVDYNWGHDIQDTGASSNTNDAVMFDLRNVTPRTFTGTDPFTRMTDVTIEGNLCEDINSTKGGEDCQPIYLKPRGFTIQWNVLTRCGSYFVSIGTDTDGPECSGILWKNTANMNAITNAFQDCRYNTFNDPPTATNLNSGNLTPAGMGGQYHSIKADPEWNFPVGVCWNTFNRAHVKIPIGGTPIIYDLAQVGNKSAIIYFYNQTGVLTVVGNVFNDCEANPYPTSDVAPGDVGNCLIAFNNWTVPSGQKSLCEVSNNVANYGPHVDYAADTRLMSIIGGSISGVQTGHNVLHGSSGQFVMRWVGSGQGTLTAPVRVNPYANPFAMVGVSAVSHLGAVTVQGSGGGAVGLGSAGMIGSAKGTTANVRVFL